MFKSEDEKRREANSKKPCVKCKGTGTIGVGGRGATTSSVCKTCDGSGEG